MSQRLIDLGYHPRPWQRKCHAARRRFTVLALHRRAGKTEWALRELVDKALRFDKELGLFVYVAPLLKQAKVIAWTRLKQIAGPLLQHGLAEVNESELWVRFAPNGAAIRLYGADNPDAMRGMRLDGAVVDEVADIKPETWTEVLQPALADRLGWAAFIGTPRGVNLFSELYFSARTLTDWMAASFTCYDTDALDAAEVERYRASVSEATFRREMLCDFSAAGPDQLISLLDVEAACSRRLAERDYAYAPTVLGVDPARFGDDRSAIVVRQGLSVRDVQVLQGVDNMVLADRVAQTIVRFTPAATFVDAGNGAGVIDRLRQLGYPVTEVHFGGAPGQPQYANKRAEMWFAVRDWIRAGGALPNLPELRQDLAAPTYGYAQATGKLQLESKNEIKRRGLPSPDIGDALALTFAYPVAEHDALRARAAAAGVPMRDQHYADVYDPYAHV